jgi:hypothetical protein
VVLRTAASFLSAAENTLDTLDGVDVVRGVVAIRDQGVREARVLRASQNLAISARDLAVSEALENRLPSRDCRGCHVRCHAIGARRAERA